MMFQVAARDEFPQRMVVQPPLAEAQQLGDLIVADPIVFFVVQDGQKHVEMGKQVSEPDLRRQADAVVWVVSPLGKSLIQRLTGDVNVVAQGLEQAPDQVRPIGRGHHGNTGFQRYGRVGKFGAFCALPSQRAAKH